jgi:hypothetical protein
VQPVQVLGGGELGKVFPVQVELLARFFGVGAVFVEITLAAVEQIALLVAADFQGGVEKFGDAFPGQDFQLDLAHFHEGNQGQANDQRGHGEIAGVAEGDLAQQGWAVLHGDILAPDVAMCNAKAGGGPWGVLMLHYINGLGFLRRARSVL